MTGPAIAPYLAELVPPASPFRAHLGLLNHFGIVAGSMTSQGLSIVLNKPFTWRYELLLGATIGVVLLLGSLVLTETPSHPSHPRETRESREFEDGSDRMVEGSPLLGVKSEGVTHMSMRELLASRDPVYARGRESRRC